MPTLPRQSVEVEENLEDAHLLRDIGGDLSDASNCDL